MRQSTSNLASKFRANPRAFACGFVCLGELKIGYAKMSAVRPGHVARGNIAKCERRSKSDASTGVIPTHY